MTSALRPTFPLLLTVAWLFACKPSRSGAEDREAAQATLPAEKAPEAQEAPAAPAAAPAPGTPERIVLAGVQLETQDPPDSGAHEIYPRLLAQSLGLLLGASGLFAVRPDEVPEGTRMRPATVHARVSYAVVSEGASETTLMASVETKLTWEDPAATDLAPGANVVVARPLLDDERKKLSSVVAAHVEEAVKEAGQSLIAKEAIRLGGAQATAGALTSGDAELVLWALDLVAARRAQESFDQVVSALTAAEPRVRSRAVSTLVALGDRRAVEPMAKSAAFDDLAFMQVVIEAVGTLGGEDAVAYLEFVQSGHPDDEVKASAAKQLTLIKHRTAR